MNSSGTAASLRQVHHAPLGAAADGAGEVERRGLGRAGRQHERAERRQLLVRRIDGPLELGDPRRPTAPPSPARWPTCSGSGVARWPPMAKRSRCTDSSSASKKLDRRGGAHHAEGRVELVHVAVGGDPRVVLGDPPAAEERRYRRSSPVRV